MRTLTGSLLAVLCGLGFYAALIHETDAQFIFGFVVMCASAIIGLVVLKY